jgi:hypothetical protein
MEPEPTIPPLIDDAPAPDMPPDDLPEDPPVEEPPPALPALPTERLCALGVEVPLPLDMQILCA